MIAKSWLAVAAVVIVAVGIVAFVSLGHGTQSGTPAQRLSGWVSSSDLGQDIGTLEGDGRNVTRAARRRGTALHTVCAAMANDAQTFNDELPSPDTRVTQWLAKAYGLDYDAAESCYRAGAGAGGAALLSSAAADRSKATALFDKVLRRVRAVTSRALPTTTTTAPDVTGTSFL